MDGAGKLASCLTMKYNVLTPYLHDELGRVEVGEVEMTSAQAQTGLLMGFIETPKAVQTKVEKPAKETKKAEK